MVCDRLYVKDDNNNRRTQYFFLVSFKKATPVLKIIQKLICVTIAQFRIIKNEKKNVLLLLLPQKMCNDLKKRNSIFKNCSYHKNCCNRK